MDRPDSQERDKQPQGTEFQRRRQGAVYQGAFEAVIAILVTALFGYWLDGRFDTAPVFLLIGFAIGFASFTVRLVRLGRWIQEHESDEPPGPADGPPDRDPNHENER